MTDRTIPRADKIAERVPAPILAAVTTDKALRPIAKALFAHLAAKHWGRSAPSFAIPLKETAEALSVSVSAVHVHLGALVEADYLRRLPGTPIAYQFGPVRHSINSV